jgi:hypothetical protein
MEDTTPLCRMLEEEFISLHGPLPDDYPKSGDEASRLAAIYNLIHQLPKKRSALCLSGGGIRSATFALGIIQGLARHQLLDKFDYLSTVSGGGYVGSWLTAWAYRHPEGISGVCRELRSLPKSPQAPEPPPIQHLRNYSNYLSPKLGLLSADTWTLLGIYLRNLLLTWQVLMPLLVAMLLIPRFCVAVVRIKPPELLLIGSLVLGFALGVMAIAYIGFNRPSINSSRRDQGSFLCWCLVPLLGSAILLTDYWAWHRNSGGEAYGIYTMVIFGALLHFFAWLIYTIGLRVFRLAELFVILVSGAAGGVSAWIVFTREFLNPLSNPSVYISFAVPLFLALFLLAATLFVGIASRWTSDEDREWWARSGAWLMIAALGWSSLSSLVIFGPLVLLKIPSIPISVGTVTGFLSILGGWSGKTSGTSRGNDNGKFRATLINGFLTLAAAVFLLFLVMVFSLGTSAFILASGRIMSGLSGISLWLPENNPNTWRNHLWIVNSSPLWFILILIACLVLLALLMGWLINTNEFSLHAMYRNRLIRAYLGASRNEGERKPNLFTGFDPEDDIPMWQLAGKEQPDMQPKRMFHVVNMALNLVGGDNLAWQQRKAESFTLSPLHAGSRCLGYRSSGLYGGGISLGTGVTISGAAASPNMGYHSSPIVTFMMALFNTRLGWWLGNPGSAGDQTYPLACPHLIALPLVAEAFGLTNDRSDYVYLSDGGHFENLGLYEMVLRRCHLIVVSDAGCDGKYSFEDLGGAIRKVRIDFGIPIEFEQAPILIGTKRKNGRHYGLARIGYSCVDGKDTDGVLIYIKPVICGDEPVDVDNYHKANPVFPHEPTSDQWFSESQFESYRALGSHTADCIWGKDWMGGKLDEFILQARQNM